MFFRAATDLDLHSASEEEEDHGIEEYFPRKRSALQDTDEEEREEDEDEGDEPVQLKTWAGLQPRMPSSGTQKPPSSSKPASTAAAKTEEDSVTGDTLLVVFVDSADGI
jgi:hypothetical protein